MDTKGKLPHLNLAAYATTNAKRLSAHTRYDSSSTIAESKVIDYLKMNSQFDG